MSKIKGSLLAIGIVLLLIGALSCCGGEVAHEHLSGKVVGIELKSEEAFLSPPYRYIVVTFDTGQVRAFNDFHLGDFVIGGEYDLVIYQNAFSRPVWVVLEGLP